MGSRICMNSTCRTKITVQWKKGWDLKSGETADLCFKCGSAYENFVYCDTFHSEETGWRECSLCNKPLHCGCSAAVAFIEIQDLGGVWCISCAQSADRVSIRRDGISSRAQTIRIYSGASNLRNVQVHNKLDADKISNGNLLSLGNIVEAKEPKYFPRPHTEHTDGSFGQVTWEVKHPGDVVDLGFPSLSQPPNEVSTFVTSNDDKRNTGTESMHEPSVHTSLNISLCSPSETSSFGLTLPNGVEEQEKSMPCLVQSGQRPRHILPKPPKSVVARGSDANKNSFTQIRVARPPAEGRLRNQLLPRYWPRITDQELQKLSGDLNSTIVPLFEKVLSASDASRIGRLVLPKACAEAYFPPINQSEGLPLKVQDVKGNEWTFQFRFWPNNNSRMYVLEGVTPCIQSMQLQAGDTVTFSRRDPGGKLVMGFRKASNSAEAQDFRTSAPNGVASGESSYADMTENLPAVNGYPGLQSLKCSKDSHLRPNFDKPNLVNGDALWVKSEKFKGKVDEDLLQQPAPSSDKKRTRNISSKNKRLLMHSEDAMELKLTWEETQDLLRPPPNVQPNIVMIEDFEFEEYNEPPVFGKKTFFVTPLPGFRGHEQWAQCDKCSKWRKLPVDVLLPPKWTCADNAWDSSRSSCSSPEEMSSNELDNLVRTTKDVKKRRIAETPAGEGCEPSGLDALATAATLGDHEESSSGATTRHPRHRPGCTCIVCIQPPSGKGKHKPSCDCNVCLTVRRRFRTLMMRKQKREAEMSQQKNHNHPTEESQLNNGTHDDATLHKDQMVCEFNEGKVLCEEGESSNKGHIDLNCHPVREEDMLVEAQLGGCMMNLVEATCLPLDVYVKHNGGIGSLGCEKQSETESCMQQQGEGQKEQGSVAEQESCATVVVVGEQERRRDQASPKDTTSD